MHSSGSHILDLIEQESHLPEIEADACVHSLIDRADCRACVDVCPTQAWILGDESLGLDTEACDGCGLCVPACPSGALHVHFPWIIRALGGQMIALFACDKSGIKENDSLLPCIHTLGLRQLLLLYNSGIEYLLLSSAECTDCAHNPKIGIHQRLEQLNRLLSERDRSPMKILQRSTQVWKKLFRTDELITRGTHLPRREFLRGGGKLLRRQLVVLDPLTLPECRTVPPGQLLPKTELDEVHWPWAPQLDEQRCDGCDACMKLCPTDALQLIQDDDDLVSGYRLGPAGCTGCGVCSTVCDSKAISVHSYIASKIRTIDLTEMRCTACGNTFHQPQYGDLREKTLCRICRIQNHSSNLFQILAENGTNAL